MRESLKVTEDIGETSAENTVDLGPVVESTQTELTAIGLEDIKDYAQYYRAKCATLNKRQLYGEVMFRNDDECVKFYTGLPNFAVLKTVFLFYCPCILKGTLPIEFVSKKAEQDGPHIDKKFAYMLCLCNNV